MKFSITKLRAAFGDIRAMEKLHVDTRTEDIINAIENKPFAVSDKSVLYAGLNELAGYHYFKTVVVGAFHIKTIKGVHLTIQGKDFKLILKSDMLELESDFSNVSNRSITYIDFEIEAEDLPKIEKSNIQSIELITKNNISVFSIIEDTDSKEKSLL